MQLPIRVAWALSCALILTTAARGQAGAAALPEGLAADDWDLLRQAVAAEVNGDRTTGLAPGGVSGPMYLAAAGTLEQQAYVKASNTDTGDGFGFSVAMDGDTAIVGAFQEGSSATGVNGDESNNGAFLSGAAYVFVRSGTTWSQQAYLKASNTGVSDKFGFAVAISGDTIVVGAEQEDSAATGVNGGQGDDPGGDGSGAAYVFVRSGTTWSQQAYLKASNTDASDRFGTAVSLDGDTIVVGAFREDSNATGVNGNQADDSAFDAGAAYVFVRSGTTWSQQAYLKASNTGAVDNFGESVSISGNTVIVGAQSEDSNATGVGGNQANDLASGAGAAYVFTRSGTTWSQQAYLKASNTGTGDGFGRPVAIDGETAVVGARLEDSGATGVGGNQADNSASSAGAAYVFTRSGTNWSQQAYLKASNTDASDQFGFAAAVDGDTVVIGTFGEDSNATGVGGDESDDSASSAGVAYVFERSGTTWSQGAYVKASNTEASDFFGRAVDVSGTSVLAGANGEDSGATGVGGNESDNGASGSGAAYVLDAPADPWEDLGFALGGTYGDPLLVGTGPLTAGSAMSIELANALENAPAVLFVGFSALNFSPFFGGTLVPDFAPPGLLVVVVTDGTGELTLGTTWPAGVTSGLEIYLQYWIDDPAAPFGFAGSNAIRGTTP